MISLQSSTLTCEERRGESYWVSFNEKSFHRGCRFKLYSGIFNGKGPLKHEHCVVKVFLNAKGTKDMCLKEMEKSCMCHQLAAGFRQDAISKSLFSIHVSDLYWAYIDQVSFLKNMLYSGKRKLYSGEAVLFEEDMRAKWDIFGKQKHLKCFANRRGELNVNAKTLSTFIHFTYHATKGKMVVCGLEGVDRREEADIHLTTPTIHSIGQKYGQGDDGFKGIQRVFENHVCNDLCRHMMRPEWNGESEAAVMSCCSPRCDNIEDGRHFFERLDSNTSMISDSMSPCLEPSAPDLNEYISNGVLNPSASPQDMKRTSQWILHEQIRNNFIGMTEKGQVPGRHSTCINDNVDTPEINGNDHMVVHTGRSRSLFSASETSGFGTASDDLTMPSQGEYRGQVQGLPQGPVLYGTNTPISHEASVQCRGRCPNCMSPTDIQNPNIFFFPSDHLIDPPPPYTSRMGSRRQSVACIEAEINGNIINNIK